jgi:molybdopterin synthase catalytic subunit
MCIESVAPVRPDGFLVQLLNGPWVFVQAEAYMRMQAKEDQAKRKAQKGAVVVVQGILKGYEERGGVATLKMEANHYTYSLHPSIYLSRTRTSQQAESEAASCELPYTDIND